MSVFGYFEIANAGNTRFTDAADGDMVVYTDTSNQSICFGVKQGSNSSFKVTNSNVNISGDIVMTGGFAPKGIRILKTQPNTVPTNVTSVVSTIPGLSTGGAVYGLSLSNSQTGYVFYGATSSNLLTLTSNAQLQASSNDTVTTPAYSWQGDSNTGMYHASLRNIGFACAGSNILSLSASNVTVNGSLNATTLQQQGSNLNTIFALSNHDAGAITTGTLAAARLPNIDASLITTGTLAAARLPANISSAIPTFTTSNVTVNGTVNAGTYQQSGIIYPRVTVMNCTSVSNAEPPTVSCSTTYGSISSSGTYPFNTIQENDLNISLTNSTFTLPAGTYEITAHLPIIGTTTGRMRVSLLNAGTNTIQRIGTTLWNGLYSTSTQVQLMGLIYTKFTIASSTTYRFIVTGPGSFTPGYGAYDTNIGDNIFSTCIIKQLA